MKSWKLIGTALLAATLSGIGPASAQKTEDVTIVVFGPPSLGAFLPPIIKSQKFDTKNGLNITFQQRPPDAYLVQFNTGEFQIGGSAALLNVGQAATKGVDVQYLFNVFDYWSYVVTSRPDVKTLKDIEGKNMAAARSTSSFRIFSWFAKQQGVDMSKVEVVNTAPPGLVSYAMADRAAAVQMWSPGYDTTIAKKPELRTLDVKIVETWEKFANSRNIPYLGVAAHTKWVKENTHLVPKLHQAYKDAADWVLANPDEASKLISPKDGEDVQRTIADLIRANDRLGLNVQWASDVQKELELIYKVGIDVDILETMPSTPTFYSGPRE